LAFSLPASPQLNSNSTPAAPGTLNAVPAPAPNSPPNIDRPDFSIKIPRPNAPAPGDYDMASDSQDSEGGVSRLHGHVVVELFNATFKADDAEYDENTHIFKARGNVSYRNYLRDEIIYCDSAEYNSDTERGTFHHVRGYTKTKVVARPGMLTTQEPFYFEGSYAEKIEDRYVLYDGVITDCHVPNPWWTLHGRKFDIFPEDHATTRNGVFRLKGYPVFYFPYFYKGLKKEPRKSGFTSPEAGHSSQFGYFAGLGYFWAINRSFDATYLFQDYTARGYSHHLDLRGKPNAKTDFDLIVYGVQDRGVTVNGVTSKAPGVSITGVAKTELGDGWIARASIDYLSSFLFRQTFSNSFNEAIYASTNSSAFVQKQFGYNTFTADVSRNEDFESITPGDSVIIRKMPEVELMGRDRQLASGAVPLWLSFDTSFAAFHRVEPTSEPGFYETSQFTPRGDFEPSVTSAFHWGALDIVPTFTMHETFYGQGFVNGAVSSKDMTRTAPEGKVTFILPPIEKIFTHKTFLGDKLKHVIEPRLEYDYVSGVNNYLNTLRFDSIDLLSNTNQLRIGVTNRLYAKKGDTVNEVLTWELYQERYFDPTFGGAVVAGQRNVITSSIDLTGYAFLSGPRNYSPVVSILRMSPRPGVGIQWQADYDPLRHTLANSMFSADVRIKKYYASAGSNVVKPDPAISPPANQFRAQVGYGDLNRKGWNTAASMVYDYKLAILEFAIAQVTYNTDCCGLSFEYRRLNFGARDDTQYRIAFSIANIGTFGNLKKQERLF
jgi:LPS-assembly protein